MRILGNTAIWRKDNGDKTHRLNYDLNQNSIVFDIGAYYGDFSDQIFAKYNCYIHAFEPIPEFFTKCQNRFKDNKKIICHKFAVSDKTGECKIYMNDNSTSLHANSSDSKNIKTKNFNEILKDLDVSMIDLIKINIEGEEYNLLEFMIQNDLHQKCKNLQVQFHKLVDNYQERYDDIALNLSKTHQLTYHYPFVWENWQIKK